MHDDLLKKIDHDYTVKKLEEMISIPSVVKEARAGGIPCMHFGPYAGGTHQKNEYTKLDTIPPVTKVYTELAARFLS